MQHLSEETKLLLKLPDDERIERIKHDIVIPYTRFKEIIENLDDLYSYPKCIRTPGALVFGGPNNGKTFLLRYFYHKYRPMVMPGDTKLVGRVALMESPNTPDENKFYIKLLDCLNALYSLNDKPAIKQKLAFSWLIKRDIKILIIDEIHNMIAGQTVKLKGLLNEIKSISNELNISIVGAGTYDALNAVQVDDQIASRFKPLELPYWELNDEYRSLLDSFEYRLPLKKPSELSSDGIAEEILRMSEGTIGEIRQILLLAASQAILNKDERITKKILSSIKYSPPSAIRNRR